MAIKINEFEGMMNAKYARLVVFVGWVMVCINNVCCMRPSRFQTKTEENIAHLSQGSVAPICVSIYINNQSITNGIVLTPNTHVNLLIQFANISQEDIFMRLIGEPHIAIEGCDEDGNVIPLALMVLKEADIGQTPHYFHLRGGNATGISNGRVRDDQTMSIIRQINEIPLSLANVQEGMMEVFLVLEYMSVDHGAFATQTFKQSLPFKVSLLNCLHLETR